MKIDYQMHSCELSVTSNELKCIKNSSIFIYIICINKINKKKGEEALCTNKNEKKLFIFTGIYKILYFYFVKQFN